MDIVYLLYVPADLYGGLEERFYGVFDTREDAEAVVRSIEDNYYREKTVILEFIVGKDYGGEEFSRLLYEQGLEKVRKRLRGDE